MGYIGAETFAAVSLGNNGKLAVRAERHRYIFFMPPLFPGNLRRPQFERHDIEVWSLEV